MHAAGAGKRLHRQGFSPIIGAPVNRNVEEHHIAAHKLLFQLNASRHLGHAGPAPTGPEVEVHHLAPEVAQRHRLAIGIAERERRGRLAGQQPALLAYLVVHVPRQGRIAVLRPKRGVSHQHGPRVAFHQLKAEQLVQRLVAGAGEAKIGRGLRVQAAGSGRICAQLAFGQQAAGVGIYKPKHRLALYLAVQLFERQLPQKIKIVGRKHCHLLRGEVVVGGVVK